MAQIICDRLECPYRGDSRFCQKEFAVINKFGLCNEFYNEDGSPRLKPLHVIQQECDEYFSRKEKLTDGQDEVSRDDGTECSESTDDGGCTSSDEQ